MYIFIYVVCLGILIYIIYLSYFAISTCMYRYVYIYINS